MTTPAILRVSSTATLPHLCAKCGIAGEHDAREQTFHYRPLWARLLGGLGAMWERRATFFFWLCPACNSRWKRAVPLSIAAFLGGVALYLLTGRFVLPALLGLVDGWASLVIGLGYFLLIIPMIYAMDFAVDLFVYRPLVVRAKNIDASGIVSLSGLHPDVVAAAQREGAAS